MEKYIYSPHHIGLVLAPLMDEPRGPVVCDCCVCKDRKAAMEAYNTWLSSPPIYKVRPEDIKDFLEPIDESQFEIRTVQKYGYKEKYLLAIPNQVLYGAVAIPKKGNGSKEQSPSVGKTYEINFAGNILCKLKVSGDTIEVEAAMNGWGDSIQLQDIEVIEIENSPTL
jgi:hypothetical protein